MVYWFFLASFCSVAQDFKLLVQGNNQYAAKNWEEAEKSFRKIVEVNPYNGENFYKLGWIHYHLEEYNEAAQHFSMAFQIGYAKALSSYNAACALALAGNQEQAMEWLSTSLKNGLQDHEGTVRSDSDLDILKATSEYLQLFPNPAAEMDREEGWRMDITYFKRKFELMHYRLFSLIDRLTWEQRFDELLAEVPTLSDTQIIVKLMQLANSTGAGHSYVVPPFQGAFHFQQLPIELYEFSDGIYIRKAHKEYQDLLEKKVLEVDGKPVGTVLEALQSVSNPENSIIGRWTGLFYMTLTDVLAGLDLAASRDEIVLTVLEGEEKKSVAVKSQPFDPTIIMGKSLPQGWVDTAEKLPLFHKRAGQPFLYEVDDENGFVYAQINQVRNGKEQSLQNFGKTIVRAAEQNNCSLVIDLRLNNGGNGMLVKDFLLEIVGSAHVNRPGNFYVLIGRKTFSAAMLLASKLDEYTHATFIGEPTGGKPTHIGDDNNFSLPYSGLIASASMTLWQSAVSYDDREWIAPDVFVPTSIEDYRLGKDPVMEAIGELMMSLKEQ
ncbi:MAG: hypothetical protein Tsb0034_21620 [Ekhidna sp.]